MGSGEQKTKDKNLTTVISCSAYGANEWEQSTENYRQSVRNVKILELVVVFLALFLVLVWFVADAIAHSVRK